MDAAGHLHERRFSSKHKWTAAEHEALAAVVKEALKRSGRIKWPDIAKAMNSGRTAKQCRERWLNTRPDAKRGLWSVDEEEAMAAMHAEIGAQWSRIMHRTNSERSGDAIKNHWNALMRCQFLDSRPETTLTVYVCLLKYGAPATKAYGYAKHLREAREATSVEERGSMTAMVKQFLKDKGEYAPTSYAMPDQDEGCSKGMSKCWMAKGPWLPQGGSAAVQANSGTSTALRGGGRAVTGYEQQNLQQLPATADIHTGPQDAITQPQRDNSVSPHAAAARDSRDSTATRKVAPISTYLPTPNNSNTRISPRSMVSEEPSYPTLAVRPYEALVATDLPVLKGANSVPVFTTPGPMPAYPTQGSALGDPLNQLVQVMAPDDAVYGTLTVEGASGQGQVVAEGDGAQRSYVRCLSTAEAAYVLEDMTPVMLKPQDGGGFVYRLVPQAQQSQSQQPVLAQPQSSGLAGAGAAAEASKTQQFIQVQKPALPQPEAPPEAPQSRALIICHCGQPALESVSMLPDSAGWHYYTCSKRPKDQSRCRFLLWNASVGVDGPHGSAPPAMTVPIPSQPPASVRTSIAVVPRTESAAKDEPVLKRARYAPSMPVPESSPRCAQGQQETARPDQKRQDLLLPVMSVEAKQCDRITGQSESSPNGQRSQQTHPFNETTHSMAVVGEKPAAPLNLHQAAGAQQHHSAPNGPFQPVTIKTINSPSAHSEPMAGWDVQGAATAVSTVSGHLPVPLPAGEHAPMAWTVPQGAPAAVDTLGTMRAGGVMQRAGAVAGAPVPSVADVQSHEEPPMRNPVPMQFVTLQPGMAMPGAPLVMPLTMAPTTETDSNGFVTTAMPNMSTLPHGAQVIYLPQGVYNPS